MNEQPRIAESGQTLDDLLVRSNLTSSQLNIWLGQMLSSDSPLYNMVLGFRITGALDQRRFQQAFASLVTQCDVLRTVITHEDGVPKQEVLPTIDKQIELVDFSSEANPEDRFRLWAHDRSRLVFDLENPLFDTALVRLGTDDHVWYFNQHHLMTDATSTALIYGRMAELYQQLGTNDGEQLDPMPSYQEYVRFERSFRTGHAAEASREFWRDHPGAFVKFFGHQRLFTGTESRRHLLELGKDRTERIRQAACLPAAKSLTTHLSQFNVLLGIYFAWLYRLTGQARLSIGTPLHNRGKSEHRRTPGLFVELLPVTVEIQPDDSFETLLRRVAAASTQTLCYGRPGSSSEISQTAFSVVLNYITAAFERFGDLPMSSEWIHAGHGDPNHHLRLQVHDFDETDSLLLFFDFNEDVFSESQQSWGMKHFTTLLDALLLEPQRLIGDVDIVGPSERSFLLSLNPSTPQMSSLSTVVDLFREQVQRCPDAVSVKHGQQEMCFAELEARSDALAHTLLKQGVAAGARVAICARRSIDMVVATMGVLKAGAAYVPLDPRLPADRLEFIVQDSGANLVLTQSSLKPKLRLGATLICIDQVSAEVLDEEAEDLSPPKLDDTAYLIYTSGSTGQPKGVIINHQSLVKYALWARETYSPSESLRFPLFSSFAFDLTVTSLFVPLISGGQIVVYEEDDDDDVDASVIKVFGDNQVDVVKLTPSHLSLVKEMDLTNSPIRTLVVGGEDFKSSLARDVSNAFRGRVDIFNEYGPTEATVACMIHRYDPVNDARESVSIGVPAEHAEIYLLDDANQLMPVGSTGEICIGGCCLAEGYLNQPELTAQRFVAHPFRPGQRVYRTGDIGRWQPNGRLDYLGRVDRQVKISGARIELTEIEAALAKHPEIGEAVVAVSRHKLPGRDDHAGRACDRCGIPANHPDVVELKEGVCNLCIAFEADRQKAAAYFRSLPELREIIDRHRQSNHGPYDCVALLSGGKDSTYALYKIVELGARPLVFSLDNGYISEGALENIRRVTDHLGLKLVLGSTPAMNEIFVESLHQFGNVCNGCFKTIYTLAMNLARERGIRYIVTGLSRGQIFDTRLAEFFRSGVYDPGTVDSAIVEARKAYHRANDVISRKLDVRMFDDDAVFDQIQFLDFYRYCDVPLEEVESFLSDGTPWVRPEDTGRSTNCLINAAGIYVHLRQRGFHNYAGPYSWDVRLGHKTKDEATHELRDNLDEQEVLRILQEIGYTDTHQSKNASSRLQAYYVADEELSSQDLQTFLKAWLPNYMIPAGFRRIERVPLTDNGKVDEQALLALDREERASRQIYAPPRNEAERSLARIWCEVLQLKRVGRDDNFWDLGGDSILNIQIVARANQVGFKLTARQLFDHPTIAELSRVVQTALPANAPVQENRVEKFGLSGLSDDSLKKLIDRLD